MKKLSFAVLLLFFCWCSWGQNCDSAYLQNVTFKKYFDAMVSLNKSRISESNYCNIQVPQSSNRQELERFFHESVKELVEQHNTTKTNYYWTNNLISAAQKAGNFISKPSEEKKKHQRMVCMEQTAWLNARWDSVRNKKPSELKLEGEWQMLTISKGISIPGEGPTIGPHVWPVVCRIDNHHGKDLPKECYVMDTWAKTFAPIDDDNGYQRCQLVKKCNWSEQKTKNRRIECNEGNSIIDYIGNYGF